MAALCLFAVPAAKAQPALGANYNEDLTTVSRAELDRIDATWLRGFIELHQVAARDPARNPNIKSILAAREQGSKTILSLKWNYRWKAFPLPGSADMERERALIERVLGAVMGKVDILVIGNEPFIEKLPGTQGDALNVFYESMARTVIDYRQRHCQPGCATQLYMGAFNRLDLPAKRTPAVARMLRFIAAQPELAGVDIHPHVPNVETTQAFIDYVVPFLRPDQTLLATEFSIVHYWKQHLTAPIDRGFARRHGLSAEMRVHHYIDRVLHAPVDAAQWQDFLSSSPWYMAQRGALTRQYRILRASGRLAVATYAARQDANPARTFSADSTPWLINSVLAAKTVKPQADGTAADNFPWADQFREIQAGDKRAARVDSR